MSQELTDEELLYASEEDWAFYNKCIEGLPTREGKNGNFWDKNGSEIPWGSGPHIIKHFREVTKIVNPKEILEIGLCLGAGASMWLNISEANVYSIDISDRDETIEAGEMLMHKFPTRFRYYIGDSKAYAQENLRPFSNVYIPGQFDLCWLDGSHDETSIVFDIEVCKTFKVPYILFDDWYPRYGETQKAVAKFPELELVKDMNNLQLFKVNY